MSIVHQMGDYIRKTILDTTALVWSNLGISFNSEEIVNDFARSTPGSLESSFYISSLDNVKRKEFNEQVALLKASNPNIVEFKVKFKRPEKPVRFYIKLVKNENS